MPTPSEPWGAEEAEGRRVWPAEQVEQLASSMKPGGRQPCNRRDVNDYLLLAPQKERTSTLLWVLVFLLLPQQRQMASRNSVTTADEDRQIDLLQPTVHHAPAVAATTCSSQRRRDARVLGPPPFGELGSPPLSRQNTLGLFPPSATPIGIRSKKKSTLPTNS